MFDTKTLLLLIPALPLAAALLVGALGKKVLREHSHQPLIVALGLACVLSLVLVTRVQQGFAEGWHAPERSEGRGFRHYHALRPSGRASRRRRAGGGGGHPGAATCRRG